ncbi:hypothetical protein EEB14_30150 [Rhodococcus sp. WS4]|nr:hypothetical protein EEB14_30150 [Rhodococcus sp. WS4]
MRHHGGPGVAHRRQDPGAAGRRAAGALLWAFVPDPRPAECTYGIRPTTRDVVEQFGSWGPGAAPEDTSTRIIKPRRQIPPDRAWGAGRTRGSRPGDRC